MGNNTIVWEGLGGLSHGSFFRVCSDDSSIDEKPPGTSLPKSPPDSLRQTAFKIMTGEAFCYSPNLSWLLMAAGTWCVFPYELEESNHASVVDLAKDRVVVNLALALAYIGFWHWALYFRGFCHRPYVPNRIYRVSKVLHK